MNFNKQDNWSDHPQYSDQKIYWSKISGTQDKTIFRAFHRNKEWKIRLNNFPEEPLYTLVVDGLEIIHFNEWPPTWFK